jgi:hypothetical protein
MQNEQWVLVERYFIARRNSQGKPPANTKVARIRISRLFSDTGSQPMARLLWTWK